MDDWLFRRDERAGNDDAVRLRPERLHYSSCFVGLNKIYFICNNTLTTEQLGRATTKIAYISTARSLHKWRHKHQLYRLFPVLFSEEVSLDTLWLCSLQRLIETSTCGVHKLLLFFPLSSSPQPEYESFWWWSVISGVSESVWSFFFHGALRPQKPHGSWGTEGKTGWGREWESRPTSLFTQLLSSGTLCGGWTLV